MLTETEPQWQKALTKANDVRVTRAHIKERIKGMPRPDAYAAVHAILADADNELWRSAKVLSLLTCPRNAGKAWAQRIMANCYASPFKLVGQLTVRQRLALLEAVEDKRRHVAGS